MPIENSRWDDSFLLKGTGIEPTNNQVRRLSWPSEKVGQSELLEGLPEHNRGIGKKQSTVPVRFHVGFMLAGARVWIMVPPLNFAM